MSCLNNGIESGEKSEPAARVVLGVMPDAQTAVMLCEALLDNGCERQRILLIDSYPPRQLPRIHERFPLHALSELDSTKLGATLSAYMLAPLSHYTHWEHIGFEAMKKTLVRLMLATHALVNASCDMAWNFYDRCLQQGKIIVTVQLDGLAQETQYSKLILSHSVDRFETLNVNL